MLVGMRVLAACSLGGAGHLNPLLPLLAAARRRGDEVRVIGPPAMSELVERAGYPFHAGAEPPEAEVAAIRERLPVAPPLEASVLGNRELFGRPRRPRCSPAWSRSAPSGRPISCSAIRVSTRPWSVAGRLGIPTAEVAISLAEAEAGSIEVAAPGSNSTVQGWSTS